MSSDETSTPKLAGWGLQYGPGAEVRGERLERLCAGAPLSRGLGRSYGDASLPAADARAPVANTTLGDRILAFDEGTGLLRAEAGLSLADIVRIYMPRGWFVPVSPGTKFVTLGGMVASDVHGKNHHVDGTFGQHVTRLTMLLADGRRVETSRDEHPDLFAATLGGMGLTGHIVEVTFHMKRIASPWIYQESERVPNIDAFVERLKASKEQWPFTMGWIDCISRGPSAGRGILMRGDWAAAADAPAHFPPAKKRLQWPFALPSWALNRLSIWAFNQLYYWKHWRKRAAGIVHPETFFYPLDAIRDWNLMYGRRGFTQFQCVLPDAAGRDAVRAFLALLTERGGASFLCVIKDCGPQGEGLLSFPMAGISVALDIPLRDNTQALIDALSAFVIDAGGRIYLTKDSHVRAKDFAAMEPRLPAFNEARDTWDPQRRLRSALSERILGDQQ